MLTCSELLQIDSTADEGVASDRISNLPAELLWMVRGKNASRK
jgi:hypothetical protein